MSGGGGNPQLPIGHDEISDEQRQAATAVVLAQVDEGLLTRAGAREVLEMLGIVSELSPPARSTVVE